MCIYMYMCVCLLSYIRNIAEKMFLTITLICFLEFITFLLLFYIHSFVNYEKEFFQMRQKYNPILTQLLFV